MPIESDFYKQIDTLSRLDASRVKFLWHPPTSSKLLAPCGVITWEKPLPTFTSMLYGPLEHDRNRTVSLLHRE